MFCFFLCLISLTDTKWRILQIFLFCLFKYLIGTDYDLYDFSVDVPIYLSIYECIFDVVSHTASVIFNNFSVIVLSFNDVFVKINSIGN